MLGKIELEGAHLVALLGTLATLAAGAIASMWQWAQNRRKSTADAVKVETDNLATANAALLNGFVLLMDQMKSERATMLTRIGDLEDDNRRMNSRINQLEAAMIRENVKIPAEPRLRIVKGE